MSTFNCRFCNSPLQHCFIDLGMSPLSNSYLSSREEIPGEKKYPLKVFVCDICFLVQLPAHVSPDNIFRDYAYFSSFSDTWIEHTRKYASRMIGEYNLTADSLVIELASNDGHLLKNFTAGGIPVLGIEPAVNVAEVAKQEGIPTITEFFGLELAESLQKRGMTADLLLGNNVLAHVPDINDFVGGMKIILKPDGIITMEFPHLLQLMKLNQFDTIYHEHYSYLSLLTVEKIFKQHGMRIFHVEELPTHGGSIRIFACHAENSKIMLRDTVETIKKAEADYGFLSLRIYTAFQDQALTVKKEMIDFLSESKRRGKSVAAYGAAAKGNTLLNYCGITCDDIDFVADRSPHKQKTLLPGSHIPVKDPGEIAKTKPDYILILPWNIQDEVIRQLSAIKEWGGSFVIPIPEVNIIHDF